jgi:carboxymethylenebutenolidase
VFSDPEQRKMLFEKFFPHVSQAKIMSDTEAFLEYLATEPDVSPGGIAVTGYCMGGLMSLTAAGTYPDRILAAASYHGPRLATDAPESPHLLAPKMRAKVYVQAFKGGDTAAVCGLFVGENEQGARRDTRASE